LPAIHWMPRERADIQYARWLLSRSCKCCIARFRGRCLLPHGEAQALRLGDVPDLLEVVAGNIARLLIFHPRVERFALISPLLAAVGAGDDAVALSGLGAVGNLQRQPVFRALAVASRLAV